MLLLIQVSAMVGGLAIVGMLGVITMWIGRSAMRRHDAAWMARARGLGVEVHGGARDWAVLRHRVNGVDLAMSRFEERVLTRRGSRTVTRAVVRSTVASSWSDAALVRSAPMFFGLGHLTELRFEPWFAFRTFAVRPEEVSAWLLPSTRVALAGAGIVHSVSVQSRMVSVILEAPPADPSGVASMMEIASSIHRGASAAPIVRPVARQAIAVPAGWFAWLLAALFGGIAFLLVPLIDPMVGALTPIVCEDGEALVRVRTTRPGHTNVDLMCDLGSRMRPAEPLAHPAVGSVGGTIAFVTTYVVTLALARSSPRRAKGAED